MTILLEPRVILLPLQCQKHELCVEDYNNIIEEDKIQRELDILVLHLVFVRCQAPKRQKYRPSLLTSYLPNPAAPDHQELRAA